MHLSRDLGVTLFAGRFLRNFFTPSKLITSNLFNTNSKNRRPLPILFSSPPHLGSRRIHNTASIMTEITHATIKGMAMSSSLDPSIDCYPAMYSLLGYQNAVSTSCVSAGCRLQDTWGNHALFFALIEACFQTWGLIWPFLFLWHFGAWSTDVGSTHKILKDLNTVIRPHQAMLTQKMWRLSPWTVREVTALFVADQLYASRLKSRLKMFFF